MCSRCVLGGFCCIDMVVYVLCMYHLPLGGFARHGCTLLFVKPNHQSPPLTTQPTHRGHDSRRKEREWEKKDPHPLKALLADDRCTKAVLDFLACTKIGTWPERPKM
ncbi:hypothetical protein FN846DRAFT_946722, partial [Sphaerosporella brunnea]